MENDTYSLQQNDYVPKDNESRCVVRVKDEFYMRGDTAFIGKSFRVMKKYSYGFNPFDEYIRYGELEHLYQIVNLDEVSDGLYEFTLTNLQTDWETGITDDWDYFLLPFDPDEDKS